VDTRKVIRTRRTVRRYKKKDVPMREIFEILDCARWAPTCKNAQTWDFIIIKSEEKIRKIAEIAGQEWIAGAPVVVVVCSNLDKARSVIGEEGELQAILECAAAVQNMLLAARDLGIGSAFVANFDREKMRELIKAPGDIFPVAVVTLGYPAEFPESERAPLRDFIHVEEFGNPWPEELPPKYRKKVSSSEFLRLFG